MYVTSMGLMSLATALDSERQVVGIAVAITARSIKESIDVTCILN
jgi:hypothetical protein